MQAHSCPVQCEQPPLPSSLSAGVWEPEKDMLNQSNLGMGINLRENKPKFSHTLRAAAKLFFRLVAMLMSSGSLQVIMAMPAVRLRIMWWAATRIWDSSESRAKSFLTICSQVVMAILIDLSTTGCTSSCTARSIAGLTHCFSWGWACSSGIYKILNKNG